MPEETPAPVTTEPMNAEQAWQIVVQACAAFQGNLTAHQQIQTALQTVGPLLASQNGQTPNRAARRHPRKDADA